MSLNVIIIAALALIVLVILIVIFTGRINVFGKGVSSCTSQGGSCVSPSDRNCFEPTTGKLINDCKEACGANSAVLTGGSCGEEQVCCLKVM